MPAIPGGKTFLSSRRKLFIITYLDKNTPLTKDDCYASKDGQL